MFCAYLFLKKKEKRNKNWKSTLVSHSSDMLIRWLFTQQEPLESP